MYSAIIFIIFIGKGYQHHCSSRREKMTNVEKLLEATPTTSQRVASRIITDAETPLLATLGPNPKAVDSKKVKRKQLFSVEDMATMQKDLSLNTRQTYRLAENMIAQSGSRHLIESNYKEKMTETNLQLEDLFETKMRTFVNITETLKIHENVQQHVVVRKNMNELVKRMVEGRNIPEENALVSIGIDGGAGFLKVCLSVFDLVGFKQPCTGKRQGERFRDSGVNPIPGGGGGLWNPQSYLPHLTSAIFMHML